MATEKAKTTRLQLTREELVEYYMYCGAKIGELQAKAAVENLRVSDITYQVTNYVTRQDQIKEALDRIDAPAPAANEQEGGKKK